MQNKNSHNNAPSGILLYAKQRGKTSFSSLSTIKKALGTTKVGHTGTLDSFADGLLVVLTGSLTRLVPHITSFDKEYLALIEFGSQTDTLDPTGVVVKTAPVPTEAAVRAVLPRFVGELAQVPPEYSAIHVGGARASDLMRAGKTAVLPPRAITIYSLNLLEASGKYALVRVRCSKGTYIRALARDIAAACGSCAHLAALRRVAVGPFTLDAAAGSSALGEFSISALTAQLAQEAQKAAGADGAVDAACGEARDGDCFYDEVRAALQPMTAPLAEYCGFVPVELLAAGEAAFTNGRPLHKRDFAPLAMAPVSATQAPLASLAGGAQLAVFYRDGAFAGMVDVVADGASSGVRLRYGFVIPQKKPIAVYTWQQVVEGGFDARFIKSGTALSVGSFDGPHIGHEALFKAVLAACKPKQGRAPLTPGVVTFSRALRGYKNPESYPGDVATLRQKLAIFAQKGFSFVVVIDFSPEFAKMQGTDFLALLQTRCGMRFLAEGTEFKCGYKGATDAAAIAAFAAERGFTFKEIAPVAYNGERVSSSRIRQAMSAGDFASARAMLDKPFALDCTDWHWERDGAVLTATPQRVQLFPCDGTYRVSVQLKSAGVGNAQCVPAACTVDAGSVRLTAAGDALSCGIQSIAFL